MSDNAEMDMEMQEQGGCNGMEAYTRKEMAELGEVSENWCNYVETYNDRHDDIGFTRYFFVDYENVHCDGLNGIRKLSEQDCVRIYYSASAETLTFGWHFRINASRAHFDYIKIEMPIKNAADCRILFDIKDITKQNRNAEYFIISKDTDFDKTIELFSVRNLKVKRIPEICKGDEAVKKEQPQTAEPEQASEVTATEIPVENEKEKREAQIRSFFGQHFREETYAKHREEIIQAVLKGNTKNQVNNNLMKIYPR